jgi:type I restriction enzyme, R subunit
MSNIGKKEKETQKRVIALFHDELTYRYLGNWEERENNANIEEEILTAWLVKKEYSENLIGKALYEFGKVANDQSKSLYDVNREVYSMLRYGVNVQPEIGHNKETVWLIDWKKPSGKRFRHCRRSDHQGDS